MPKSKGTKKTSFLEVDMSKKCAPLWRESHLEVKSVKDDCLRPLLDLQMWFGMAGARDCVHSQN